MALQTIWEPQTVRGLGVSNSLSVPLEPFKEVILIHDGLQLLQLEDKEFQRGVGQQPETQGHKMLEHTTEPLHCGKARLQRPTGPASLMASTKCDRAWMFNGQAVDG